MRKHIVPAVEKAAQNKRVIYSLCKLFLLTAFLETHLSLPLGPIASTGVVMIAEAEDINDVMDVFSLERGDLTGSSQIAETVKGDEVERLTT